MHMCVCFDVCMYVCICVYVVIHAHIRKPSNRKPPPAHTHTHTHTYTHIHTHTHTHTHAHTHTHTHTHTCTGQAIESRREKTSTWRASWEPQAQRRNRELPPREPQRITTATICNRTCHNRPGCFAGTWREFSIAWTDLQWSRVAFAVQSSQPMAGNWRQFASPGQKNKIHRRE